MTIPQFITDEKGKKLSVILPMKDYKKILEELEELEDIRLYDEAMTAGEKPIAAKKAFKMIEAKSKKAK